MDTRQIQSFLAVQQSGGFTSAARRLHVNQSTLSRQIAALENELGAALFERGTGGVRLTKAGEVFLQEGEELLLRYERLRDKLGRIGNGVSGKLRVGMPMNLFGENAIFDRYDPAAVGGEVEFRYRILDFEELNQSLLDGEIDLAITYDFAIEEIREEVECRFAFSEPFVFFVRKGHRLCEKGRVEIDDLSESGLTALRTDIMPPFLSRVLRLCRQREGGVRHTRNPESMMMEVSTSDRVGVVPKSMFQSSQAAYGLVALEIPELDTGADFVLAQRKNDQNPLIRTYTNLLRTWVWKRKW